MTLDRRVVLLALSGFALFPRGPMAAPIRYELDTKASNVGFRFSLSGVEQTGSMPVQHANIRVDPGNLAKSTVDVTLFVAGARTGLVFATQAMLGPDVLDVARYPTIRFVSDRVQLAADGRLSGGARIAGQLTVHGITSPITLKADLFRAQGSARDDLSELRVLLSGQISRKAFGAGGYPDLVGDTVGLDITAAIRAVR